MGAGSERKKLKLLERDPMAELGAYRDQRFAGNRVQQDTALLHTSTLYKKLKSIQIL